MTDPTPGGGGPALRRQLAILRTFLAGLPFVRMAPNAAVVRGGLPPKVTARALAEPGRAYAVYVRGDTGRPTTLKLELELPPGNYRAEWVDTRSGAVARGADLAHGGGRVTLESPPYEEDIALRVVAR